MNESIEPRSAGERGWRRLLDRIERVGDALPDPVFIFIGCIALLVAGSVVASALGWSAVNPVTGKHLAAESLLSRENLAKLFVDMPETMTKFPPLGLVLVVMLGAAVAERSGLFGALLGDAIRKLPKAILSPAIFVIGVMSSPCGRRGLCGSHPDGRADLRRGWTPSAGGRRHRLRRHLRAPSPAT